MSAIVVRAVLRKVLTSCSWGVIIPIGEGNVDLGGHRCLK
jgi:hypothetical protein